MKQTHTVTIRLNDGDYSLLQAEALRKHKNISQLIRDKLKEPDSDDWIKKEDLIPVIMSLSAILDRDEYKEIRTCKKLRKEFQKLWELL